VSVIKWLVGNEAVNILYMQAGIFNGQLYCLEM